MRETKEVPNRTGSGVNVRKVEEALEQLLTRRADDSDGYDDDAFFLAPIIERAVDAVIDAFVEAYNFTGPMPDNARQAWRDVFVAAMMEES